MSNNPVEHIDFYFNESGLMVLTEKYHRERGYCCGNGCLHCPFDFDAVPQPRKSDLQLKKNKLISSAVSKNTSA